MDNQILGNMPRKTILIGVLICFFSILTILFAIYVLFFDNENVMKMLSLF